jgi:hypothetical protein
VKARPVAAAGYSGTPLPRKLGMKPGMNVALLGGPPDFASTLGALPEGVTLSRGLKGTPDLVIWFVRTREELGAGIGRAAAFAGPSHTWIAWRKRASLRRDDPAAAAAPDENTVRSAGLAAGLVDFKVCAIDAEWSGLLFSRRQAGERTGR